MPPAMKYPVALQTHNFSTTSPTSTQPATPLPENKASVTKITNCRILRDHKIVEHDAIWIQGGKIIDPHKFFWYQKRLPDLVLDAGGLLVVPGFIEVQINGAFGFDFSIASDPETYEQGLLKVSRGLVKYGTTSYCPTIVSSTASDYNSILPHLKPRPGSAQTGASILGAHVEGPFINESRAGAHPLDVLRSSAMNGFDDFKDVYGLQDADEDGSSNHHNDNIDSIKLFTCAPELEGVADIIPDLVKAGITVSIGHSMANISQAEKAVTNGATFIAHLFNAMPQFHHRDPGVIGLLGSRMDLPRPYYGLICDGMHVHPNSVKIAYDSHPEGVILCTAMSPLGLGQDDEEHQEKVHVNATNTSTDGGTLEIDTDIDSSFNKVNGLRIDLDNVSTRQSEGHHAITGVEHNDGFLPTPPGSTPLSPLKMTARTPESEGVDATRVAAAVRERLLPPQMMSQQQQQQQRQTSSTSVVVVGGSSSSSASTKTSFLPWIKTVYSHSDEYDEHEAYSEYEDYEGSIHSLRILTLHITDSDDDLFENGGSSLMSDRFVSDSAALKESPVVPVTFTTIDTSSATNNVTTTTTTTTFTTSSVAVSAASAAADAFPVNNVFQVEMTDCNCKHHVQHVLGSDCGGQKGGPSSSPSVRTQRSNSDPADLCCPSSSVITMDACIRNFIEFTSCSLIEALEAVTLHPAVMLGIQATKGVIQPGADADLVFLSDDLFVKRVFVAGEEVMDL